MIRRARDRFGLYPEMLAADTAESIYSYEWETGEVYRILPAPIIHGVVRDIQKSVEPTEISAKFHGTLIRLFADLCAVIGRERGLKRVVLSGGVFQNTLLLNGLTEALENKNFQVHTHQRVPANDGGIALGQAVVAAAVSRDKCLSDKKPIAAGNRSHNRIIL